MKEGQAIVGGCGMGAQCAAAIRYGMEDAGSFRCNTMGREGGSNETIRGAGRTTDGRAPFDARSHPHNVGRTSVVIADVATHAFLSTSSLTSEFLASVLTSLEMRISIHTVIANGSDVGSS
jgi:hypothetical protein